MKTIEQCKTLSKPQLLGEIRNRNTLIKAFNSPSRNEELKSEIAKLWKLMEGKMI